MELDDDIVGEIISHLPLKFAVQCKVLNKNFKGRISDPKFSQTLFQRQKDCSTQLIYTSNGLFRKFHKISINLIPITQCVTNLPYDIELLASCKGLILFDFDEIMIYCVFNPVTGEHQLISYPESTNRFENIGLAVDYPNSNHYELVSISKLAENSNLFYKFHLLSSERSGLWREIQLRCDTSSSFAFSSPSVYWCDSLYWLRSDGSVLAFDTKREEAILIDRPKFINHCDCTYGKILTGGDIWLGMAQGLLKLVCIFIKSIVIATYDNKSSNWRVSHTLDNFVLGPYDIINGFPVCIHSKEVFFLVDCPLTLYHDVYEYDTEINGYKKVAVLRSVDYPLHCFDPTLACVHKTPSDKVKTAHLSYIVAKLDEVRRFIIEGISNQEEEEESSSSSSEESSSGEEQEIL